MLNNKNPSSGYGTTFVTSFVHPERDDKNSLKYFFIIYLSTYISTVRLFFSDGLCVHNACMSKTVLIEILLQYFIPFYCTFPPGAKLFQKHYLFVYW